MAEEELLLSTRRPSRTQLRTVVTVALLLSLAFLISLPFLNHALGRTFIVIPEALTYAHAFSERGLLSAGLSTSTWLYLFWHTGFAITVMGYAALKTNDAAWPRSSSH
jgi:hypothetical protein